MEKVRRSVMTVQKITEDTLIPLSLLVLLSGAGVWIASLGAKAETNARAIERIESKQDRYNETVQSIDKRLSRMEGKMGVVGD